MNRERRKIKKWAVSCSDFKSEGIVKLLNFLCGHFLVVEVTNVETETEYYHKVKDKDKYIILSDMSGYANIYFTSQPGEELGEEISDIVRLRPEHLIIHCASSDVGLFSERDARILGCGRSVPCLRGTTAVIDCMFDENVLLICYNYEALGSAERELKEIVHDFLSAEK